MRTAILLPLLAAGLAGCATAVPPVEVTRFHRIDASVAARASYAFAPADSATGSIEQRSYEAAVARELDRLGYVPASGAASDLLVRVDVQRLVGEEARRSPVSVGVGGSTGSYGSGVGLGVGINLGGGPRELVATRLAVRIDRRGEALALWEGRAETVASARSPAAQPGIAADKLASALFRDFPGRSGETITVE